MAEVISDVQRQLNAALHEHDDNFGNRADGAGLATHLPAALGRMHELGACASLLDYGTGKGALVQRLRAELPPDVHVQGYDPAMPAFATKPEQPADILVCLDVLEHIEMASIDAVLRDIHALTRQFCYLVIDLQPAVKTLADGRNAHILLAPPEWWVGRVAQLFACQASFPVMHKAGVPQKLVIAACHRPQVLPLLYGFLIKLKLFDFAMSGGVLEGMAKLQKQQAAKAKR
ncbi:class I SAM-dependent methyltransferase [Cyanobium sp. ATX 6E8]|uniref:methyltransferase domain-containing protein n=1 Tax=Cyanobium sp. ATX 6E8 TaxID=2823701 RepID=UPI0020CE25FC|nr:class I SAM-dependent methyltransferase [Cyanobium sp. ATX 6E8]MCP9941952.1 class I SAM-dependent methyltransferase [Cyanobium sp. ATX 6E8]